MSASQLSPRQKDPTTLAAVLSLAKRYKLINSNPVDDVERVNLSSEEDNEAVTPDKVYAHFVPRETAAIHNLAESILQAQ